MDIRRHLLTLSRKDPIERREALALVLTEEGLDFFIQEAPPEQGNPMGTQNYMLIPQSAKVPYLLLGAHYDAQYGSFGANDNAAGVCILIDLALALREKDIPVRFAFFDGEESGLTGSRLCVAESDPKEITGYINLDVCGYGDTIAVYGKGHEKKPFFAAFSEKERLQIYNAQLVRYLPDSDNKSFIKAHIPSLSICIVPRWDIAYLKALASYGGAFIGRPPEFNMMESEMEVMTTMHGGYRDSPEFVEDEAMRQVYDYVYDAITAEVPSKKPGRR